LKSNNWVTFSFTHFSSLAAMVFILVLVFNFNQCRVIPISEQWGGGCAGIKKSPENYPGDFGFMKLLN
jgi:hypothetical protein